jgi:CheY-like chemotaxis protein
LNQAQVGRILVVDDDPAIARMLRVILESDGFHVESAENGLEALRLLDGFVPQLVFLDLQMPVMDGRTFYHEFRNRGFQTPVVIVSAFNAAQGQAELRAEGALSKPFEPDELIRVSQRLIRRS